MLADALVAGSLTFTAVAMVTHSIRDFDSRSNSESTYSEPEPEEVVEAPL